MSNLAIYTGDTRTLNFAVYDSDGAAVDITTATIAFKVIRRKTRAVLVSLSVGSGVTVTSGVGGTFSVDITATHTSTYPGSHYFEAEVTIGSEVSTVAAGVIEFIPSPAS